MDFIHCLVSQDQKKQKWSKKKKTKTWTDQLTKHPHTNHTRTASQTTEQQTWTHTYITTWSQKTQVAKNDTPTHKSQMQKEQNTNTEQQTWKNTCMHIHTNLEHTRDNMYMCVQVCCSVVCNVDLYVLRFQFFFFFVYNFSFFLVLRHQMMDKVHKHNLINTNTPSSESYRSDHIFGPTKVLSK
jgi:hypothetical protein